MDRLESTPKELRNTLLLASLAIIFAAIMFAQAIVVPLLMSLFISIICTQPIIWLKAKKIPATLALAIVFAGILAIFIVIGELIAGSLSSFTNNVAVYEANLNSIAKSVMEFMNGKGLDISFDNFSEKSSQ